MSAERQPGPTHWEKEMGKPKESQIWVCGLIDMIWYSTSNQISAKGNQHSHAEERKLTSKGNIRYVVSLMVDRVSRSIM